MIDVHPVLDLTPTGTVTLTSDWDFFWRESTADGLSRQLGTVLKPAGTDKARFVGYAPSLTAVWSPTPHVSVLASDVHFSAGELIRDNLPAKISIFSRSGSPTSSKIRLS